MTFKDGFPVLRSLGRHCISSNSQVHSVYYFYCLKGLDPIEIKLKKVREDKGLTIREEKSSESNMITLIRGDKHF